MINKKQAEKIIELLDERFYIATINDKEKGNTSDYFIPSNVDYIYYKGMIHMIEALGISWKRENGKHKLYF